MMADNSFPSGLPASTERLRVPRPVDGPPPVPDVAYIPPSYSVPQPPAPPFPVYKPVDPRLSLGVLNQLDKMNILAQIPDETAEILTRSALQATVASIPPIATLALMEVVGISAETSLSSTKGTLEENLKLAAGILISTGIHSLTPLLKNYFERQESQELLERLKSIEGLKLDKLKARQEIALHVDNTMNAYMGGYLDMSGIVEIDVLETIATSYARGYGRVYPHVDVYRSALPDVQSMSSLGGSLTSSHLDRDTRYDKGKFLLDRCEALFGEHVRNGMPLTQQQERILSDVTFAVVSPLMSHRKEEDMAVQLDKAADQLDRIKEGAGLDVRQRLKELNGLDAALASNVPKKFFERLCERVVGQVDLNLTGKSQPVVEPPGMGR